MYRHHKYNARRTICNLAHYHPSRLEAHHCDKLLLLKKAGEIQDFIYQKSYDLVVNGKTICKHKPDFTVTRKDGLIEVHETKGIETMDWHLRRNLFEACYPRIPYLVFKK